MNVHIFAPPILKTWFRVLPYGCRKFRGPNFKTNKGAILWGLKNENGFRVIECNESSNPYLGVSMYEVTKVKKVSH